MAQEWWLFPAEGLELSLVEPVLQGKGKKKKKKEIKNTYIK